MGAAISILSGQVRERLPQSVPAQRQLQHGAVRGRQLQEIQDQIEEMQREAMRAAEGNELRRTQEEIRQAQGSMEMQEEIRRVQEESRKLQEKLRMDEVWIRKEAERNLENGISPVKYPTGDDFRVVRERMQYQEGNLHIAIAGVSGSGKSSLINAFRGYSNKHPDAAKTGTRETTEAIGRFCDPSRPWMFWYDVPDAGTLKVPDWQYFNDQGLYIFDIIIIAVDIRFTKIDAGVLFNCKRFGIPAFVVRSKADQHIANTMKDNHESDDEGDGGGRDSLQNTENRFIVARDKFVQETRQEYATIFKEAGLPPQKVYIISNGSVRRVIKGSKNPVDIIDEIDLIGDILYAANERRRQDQSQPQSA